MVGKKSDAVIAPYPPDRLGVDKMHPGSPDCRFTEARKKKNRKRPLVNVSVRSRLNWNLNNFSRRGKDRSTWKKTSRSKGENQQQTDMVLTLGLEPGLHRW